MTTKSNTQRIAEAVAALTETRALLTECIGNPDESALDARRDAIQSAIQRAAWVIGTEPTRVEPTTLCYGCYYQRPDGDALHDVLCARAWPCRTCGRLIKSTELTRFEHVTADGHHVSYCSEACHKEGSQ